MEVIKWYLENVGIKTIKRRTNANSALAVRWIKEFFKIIKDRLYEAANNINENNFDARNKKYIDIRG